MASSLVFVSFFSLFLLYLITCQELLLKTNGSKGKGSIILLGKKCVPTLIKSGGKKSKDIVIVGDNKDCGSKHIIPKFIPVYQKSYQTPLSYQHAYHPMMSSYARYGAYSGGYGNLMTNNYGGFGYGETSGYGYTPGSFNNFGNGYGFGHTNY